MIFVCAMATSCVRYSMWTLSGVVAKAVLDFLAGGFDFVLTLACVVVVGGVRLVVGGG